MIDEEIKKYVDEAIEKALRPVERKGNQGAGAFYSRLLRQLDDLVLQVEGLSNTLIQVLPVLQKLDPSFDARPLLESCNELRKKRETDGEADFDRW